MYLETVLIDFIFSFKFAIMNRRFESSYLCSFLDTHKFPATFSSFLPSHQSSSSIVNLFSIIPHRSN
jgi:hypothetical protein